MVGTSKVLTVSYGTFSCTLEGFDDSFDTMKAIAEYFRDLAADDRYFGAEPPTPDAEMLARIAEKEIARRVEARLEGDNIVLRTALPAGAAMAAAAARDIADDDVPASAEPSTAADTSLIPEAEETVEDEAGAPETADADALSPEIDIRAIQAATEETTEEASVDFGEETAELAEANVEDALDVIAEAVTDETSAPVATEDNSAASVEAPEDAAAEETIEASAEPLLEETPATAETAAEIEDDGSIAAKLARIRAVVGKPQQAEAAPFYSEDEHAEEILDTLAGDTDLADIITEPSEDAAEADEAADQDDTIANVMQSLSAGETDTLAEAEEGAAIEDAPEAPLAEDILEVETPEPVADQQAEVEPDPAQAEVEPQADGEAEADQAPVTPRRPVRARVIKMKRAEFEQAVAEGTIEEVAEDSTATGASAADDTSLTPEDEDELQRELAAVEAELAGLDAADVAPEPQAVEAPVAADVSGHDDLANPPEAEMDRLISQTHNELEEPEGKQRRSALGHLRAAVAAARADKNAGTSLEKADNTEAYRSDLDDAVRPARPVRRVTGQAPARVAPTPLKLVAEQRIDLPQDSAAGEAATPARPVRPRRVAKAEPLPPVMTETAGSDIQDDSAQDVTEISADGTFMDFAEVMGATELPDLLEAAAAYLAFVEGRDQFSRPQLMTKVRMVQEDNFSREDGLRSFGQLLRQGKIEKIAGGRFTVSDRISFKPDTRAAG